VVKISCTSQKPIKWPILIGHLCGQNCYKWSPSICRGLTPPTSLLLFLFLFLLMLVCFCYFGSKWPRNISSINHTELIGVFINHDRVLYVNRRGTFGVLIIGYRHSMINRRIQWWFLKYDSWSNVAGRTEAKICRSCKTFWSILEIGARHARLLRTCWKFLLN
jgi:hypothetical protein